MCCSPDVAIISYQQTDAGKQTNCCVKSFSLHHSRNALKRLRIFYEQGHIVGDTMSWLGEKWKEIKDLLESIFWYPLSH